jgi:hypothetical protein
MKPLLSTLTLLCLAVQAADVKPAIDGTAAWSKLKTLVGHWEGDGSMGKVSLTYELIAGGTALIERERTAKTPEMLTVYHLDGKRLVLTHYCMAGNQPRMEARSFNPGTGDLAFDFLDATNMPSPNAGHMRNVSMKLSDDKHLSSEWRFYENGQMTMNVTAQYTRVK